MKDQPRVPGLMRVAPPAPGDMPTRLQHDVIVKYELFVGPVDQFAPELGIRSTNGAVPIALSFVEPGSGRRTTAALEPQTVEFLTKKLTGGVILAHEMPTPKPG